MSVSTVVGGVPAGQVGEPGRRRWFVLGVVALAQLMIVLDSTVVNIALPSAQRALGFPNSDRQWVVTPTPWPSAACCWWVAGSATRVGRNWEARFFTASPLVLLHSVP
jgi:MFS family permease